MKQLLFFICLSIAFMKLEAQQNSKKSRFAFVSVPFDANDGMYAIRIDSGQAPITRKGPIMTDSFGRSIKFVSPAGALNYLEGIGWTLAEVLHDTEGSYGLGTGSVGTTLSYLFKKDYW